MSANGVVFLLHHQPRGRSHGNIESGLIGLEFKKSQIQRHTIQCLILIFERKLNSVRKQHFFQDQKLAKIVPQYTSTSS